MIVSLGLSSFKKGVFDARNFSVVSAECHMKTYMSSPFVRIVWAWESRTRTAPVPTIARLPVG